jgi:DNA-binding NtrC family response regulator
MAIILVIDDDEAVRDSVRIVLTRANHKVIVAENADAGVRCYPSVRPDVVITDLLMPAKDGIEAVREIRRIDPKARIVAMSGGSESTELRFRALVEEFGAIESLLKPFRVAQLLAVIERVLNTPP